MNEQERALLDEDAMVVDALRTDDLREGYSATEGERMKKSKKASSRVTAPNQQAAAAADASKTASRRKAVGSNAAQNTAKRQTQKTQATAIRAHMRASGQRRQAKRDAR